MCHVDFSFLQASQILWTMQRVCKCWLQKCVCLQSRLLTNWMLEISPRNYTHNNRTFLDMKDTPVLLLRCGCSSLRPFTEPASIRVNPRTGACNQGLRKSNLISMCLYTRNNFCAFAPNDNKVLFSSCGREMPLNQINSRLVLSPLDHI